MILSVFHILETFGARCGQILPNTFNQFAISFIFSLRVIIIAVIVVIFASFRWLHNGALVWRITFNGASLC